MLNLVIASLKKALVLLAAVLLLRSAFTALQQHQRKTTQVGTGTLHEEIIFDTSDSPGSPAPSLALINDTFDLRTAANEDQEQIPATIDDASTTNLPAQPPLANQDVKDQWAIVYFPYTPLATCKTALTVRSDITSIYNHGFTSVRLHASDCNALYTVSSAAALHGMKMILGVHVDDANPWAPDAATDSPPDPIKMVEEQVSDMIDWAKDPTTPGFSIIELIVLGEETVFNSILGADELAELLRSTRAKLRAAGYQGPITTTEPIPTLYENADVLCQVIDVAASNIHPYFSSAVPASQAGLYVRDALHVLDQICPGKPPSLNLETGWPTRGQRNGEAVPGSLEQAAAIRGIMKQAGSRSVIIGWGDDTWKDEGELGVEGAWGCEGLFAKAQDRGTLAEEDEEAPTKAKPPHKNSKVKAKSDDEKELEKNEVR